MADTTGRIPLWLIGTVAGIPVIGLIELTKLTSTGGVEGNDGGVDESNREVGVEDEVAGDVKANDPVADDDVMLQLA
ncbi:uncharacterized protein A4U43_C07F3400 [Asparagus officinalis]|uniref:Uncharacterized protein n=2 Tax=Petrosaviidae TaxID=1437197 RepID=A0A5P1E965_ASPOF|nr:uncharacterized protein A4U43_C07F3400 [Asparagus officinalis]